MCLLNFFKDRKKYLAPFIVISICGYALYLRLLKLFQHKLWDDELYQLQLMQGSFLDLLKQVSRAEFCSYLSGDYYLIYPFFKIFGFNKWGLAIPHIISTIIGFYLVYWFCKRYFKSVWGYIITFSVVCLNATLIWHATEIRIYAVLSTLALACLYFWLKLLDRNYEINKGKKIAIGIFFILTIWFHVYGILIFSCTAIYALTVRVKGEHFCSVFKNTGRFVLIIFSIALPLWIISVFGPHLDVGRYRINTFEFIPNPLSNTVGFFKGVFGNLVGYKKLYFLLLGMIVPFILPYKDRFRQIAWLFILVFIPIIAILIGCIFSGYWFLQRLFIWVMPFFALFLGWSWDSAFRYIRDKLSVILHEGK